MSHDPLASFDENAFEKLDSDKTATEHCDGSTPVERCGGSTPTAPTEHCGDLIPVELCGGSTPTGRYIVSPEDYVIGTNDGRWLSSTVTVDLEEVA
ncbi:thioredoxin reductase [Halogeometricum borinquense]|uniref:Thioredoxin reductase n=1 Tax=Halogeometricum borinquense TaxID=60847 RepID=A0A6C0ULE6_9EURY|nr:thioredoxin reductase [Halogeometricum borinquense]QIB76020.1 thioredoxin reductase [Halogeometricum borinquense]